MSILCFPFITSSPSLMAALSTLRLYYVAILVYMRPRAWGKGEDSSRDNRPLRMVDKIYRRERERKSAVPFASRSLLCPTVILHLFVLEDFASLLRSIRCIIKIMTRSTRVAIFLKILRKSENWSVIWLNLLDAVISIIHLSSYSTRKKIFRELIFFTHWIIFLLNANIQ